MRLKLDENLGRQAAELFRQRGHEVATVPEEGLTSAPDHTLIEVARKESRCLVTLDLDFGNPLLFKPFEHRGIAVLRLPAKPAHADLLVVARTLAAGLEKNAIDGKLWIVQKGRIRQYQDPNAEI